MESAELKRRLRLLGPTILGISGYLENDIAFRKGPLQSMRFLWNQKKWFQYWLNDNKVG